LTATTAVAAGSTVIQSVAANSAAVAMTAGVALLKLTTGVADTTSLQTMFNSAIGTSTVTGVGAGTELYFSLYDTTNSRMVVGLVDSVTTTDTSINTGDIVTLIGSLNMTAADYALFASANLSINDV